MASGEQGLKQSLLETAVPTSAASDATRVRLVTADDYARLARFVAGFADETRSEQFWLKRFRFWWDENPAYHEGVPRGWVLWEENEIKGYLGNVPTEFQLNGKPVTALTLTTWRVLHTHRNHSLHLLYQAIRCAKGAISFNTTPSDDAARVMKGVKFNLFPYYADPIKSVIVVNPRRVLRSRGKSQVLSALAAWFGAPVLRVFQDYRTHLERESKQTSVRLMTHADSSFDDLWLRTRNCYAHTNVRTAAAINWQCFLSEDFRRFLFACMHGDRLLGYLIAATGVRNGLNVASCADLWLDPDSPAALRDLLSFARHWADKEGVDVIEIPHFDRALGRQLAALGLFQRRFSGEQPAYYKAPDLGMLNPASSYLVGLQGDRGL
jgi:hypothetical protein